MVEQGKIERAFVNFHSVNFHLEVRVHLLRVSTLEAGKLQKESLDLD